MCGQKFKETHLPPQALKKKKGFLKVFPKKTNLFPEKGDFLPATRLTLL